MIIPIRCFTCGQVLADKWNYYQNKVIERRKEDSNYNSKDNLISNTNINDIKKSIEGIILDELGLTRLCCRRHMLTHVDLTN